MVVVVASVPRGSTIKDKTRAIGGFAESEVLGLPSACSQVRGAHPSIADLQRETGRSKRSVRAALDRLAARGDVVLSEHGPGLPVTVAPDEVSR